MAVSHILELFFSIVHKSKSFISICHEKISKLLSSLLRSLSSSGSTTTSRSSPKNNLLTHFPSDIEKFLSFLGPEFTSDDVDVILSVQTDPDLAFSIFCKTSFKLGRRHCSSTYRTMLQISVSSGRFSAAESLISDVISGAIHPDLPLLNSAIHFCCSRRHLFSRAFDLYKLTLSPNATCCPSLETFSLLLIALLDRMGKPPMCYIYLGKVCSLISHMKSLNIVLDTLTFNLIINIHSICLDMDEAEKVFHEMVINGCQPNQYTYEYVVQGFCDKGSVDRSLFYFMKMRVKRIVPTSRLYMVLICSLAVEGMFNSCINVLVDMLGNSMMPNISTYSTILSEMRNGGKINEAFGLLNDLERMEGAMHPWFYSVLLDELNSAPKSDDLELLLGEGELHWC